MTERLYWNDSHLREFEGRVRACEALPDGRWAVILDQTAFFPEGGGQAADTGTLGDRAVLHVRERNGEAEHLCDGPLSVGNTVHGSIDWDKRFQRMQFHSGEHILSGLASSPSDTSGADAIR